MPKVSGSGNASAYGQEGHIVGADGVLSELDPSHNVDGSRVEGYESEPAGGQEESAEEGEQSSRGSSSETSSGRTGKTATKK